VPTVYHGERVARDNGSKRVGNARGKGAVLEMTRYQYISSCRKHDDDKGQMEKA
jgi:hypothetical protein